MFGKSVNDPQKGHMEEGSMRIVETVVYYESIKRELKTKPIYECLCDERPKHKAEESTRLACTGVHDKTN